jgi:hypothetical protein
MVRISGPLFVGLLGFAVGCGDGAGPPVVSRATGAIVGPSTNDDHDRAAVLVEVRTASGETGTCSGVVVAPSVVLTAAHCVAPQALGVGATFSIFLGDDPLDPEQMALSENHVAVVAATADPKFDLTLLQAGHDVAVLVTQTPLSVVPLALEPAPELDGVENVRVVGFGITELKAGGALRAGRRRDAIVALASYDDRFLELGLSESAPCLGDSGGPVFVELADGAQALVGIVSFTDARCGPFSRVTRLMPYESFILSAIAESESPPVPDAGDTPEPAEAGPLRGNQVGTVSGGCTIRRGSGTHTSWFAGSGMLVLYYGRRRRRARRPAVIR